MRRLLGRQSLACPEISLESKSAETKGRDFFRLFGEAKLNTLMPQFTKNAKNKNDYCD